MPAPQSVFYVVFLSLLLGAVHRGSKVVVSLTALQLGADALIVGVLAALFALFPLLLAVHAGRLSDRIGVRAPMLLGALLVALALTLPAFIAGLPALIACASLVGLGHVYFHVAVHNAVGALGRSEDRTRNFAIFSLGASIAAMLGPSLTGFAIDSFGYQTTYVGLALVAVCVTLFGLPGLSRAAVRSPTHEDSVSGSTIELLRNPSLRRTLLMSGVALTGIDLYTFYMPVYGRTIGLSASTIGLVLGAYAAAAFVVRIVMHRLAQRYTELGVLTASLFVAAGSYVLIPFQSAPLLLASLGFVLGLGLGSAQPLTIALTYAHAPKGRSGEALGLRITVNKITQIGVPLVFGGIGSAFGVLPVFLANAAFLLGGGILSLRMLRSPARRSGA